MKATEKNMFAIAVSKNGRVCGIGRVDTMKDLVDAVKRNRSRRLNTEVRHLDLRGVARVVAKIMPPDLTHDHQSTSAQEGIAE